MAACNIKSTLSSCSTMILGTTNHMICAALLDQLCSHTRTCAPRSMIIWRRLTAKTKQKPSD